MSGFALRVSIINSEERCKITERECRENGKNCITFDLSRKHPRKQSQTISPTGVLDYTSKTEEKRFDPVKTRVK